MNFIKPLGRTIDDGVQPTACMCHTGFAAGRGANDNCFHCGCACGSGGAYYTADRQTAFFTVRAS